MAFGALRGGSGLLAPRSQPASSCSRRASRSQTEGLGMPVRRGNSVSRRGSGAEPRALPSRLPGNTSCRLLVPKLRVWECQSAGKLCFAAGVWYLARTSPSRPPCHRVAHEGPLTNPQFGNKDAEKPAAKERETKEGKHVGREFHNMNCSVQPASFPCGRYPLPAASFPN